MALKITKDIEKKLSNIANQLPLTTYGVPKVRFKRLDSKRVLKQTYGEMLHVVNHKNRIKTVYVSGGVEAVKDYVKGVIELASNKIMKPVELRLGNLTLRNGEIWPVYQIEKRFKNVYRINDININFDNPVESSELCGKIPLTKEWLVKFGFIANKYNGEFTLNEIMLDSEYTDKGTFNLSIGLLQSEIEIKYVHQLQNLYFALTNEELIIKP